VCLLAAELLPRRFGRLDQAGAERVVEQQALIFEQTKPSLLERWA